MISRRGFFTGLVAAVAAPAVITRPGILMPLRGLVMPWDWPMKEVALGYGITETDINFGDIVRWILVPGEEWGMWVKA